ncbi:transposase, partial [Endozoicomonas sp. YOMI1]|uniref:transposase n=1 Tax=Endozoicomonas sp. YOMI1 TaxID=2828739 RepID=UPI0021491E86
DERSFETQKCANYYGSIPKVPQRGGRNARKARKIILEVKKKTATIQSPQRPGGRLAPITVNVLIAEEINNDTEDRLCWILLTSESLETFEDCRTVLRFYELRWRIEEFHKAWKTGAGVERLRMLCAGNMQRLAVILMFVAVRLLQIRKALILPYDRKAKGDKTWNEKTPANKVVSDEEWKVLWITYYENKSLPKPSDSKKPEVLTNASSFAVSGAGTKSRTRDPLITS